MNRRRMKQYGLDLGNYTIGAVFSPEVDPRTDGQLRTSGRSTSTSVTAVGRNDFYLAVPAAAIRFLEDDSETEAPGQAAAARRRGRGADARSR